jgi:hypothetical protein
VQDEALASEVCERSVVGADGPPQVGLDREPVRRMVAPARVVAAITVSAEILRVVQPSSGAMASPTLTVAKISRARTTIGGANVSTMPSQSRVASLACAMLTSTTNWSPP